MVFQLSDAKNYSSFSSKNSAIVLEPADETAGILVYTNNARTLSLSNDASSARLDLHNSTKVATIACASNGSMTISTEDSTRMTFTPTGLIDVTTSETLSVPPYGYLAALGSVGYDEVGESASISMRLSERLVCKEVNATSDARLKENIRDLEVNRAYEFVEKIKPKTYSWIGKHEPRRTGYIAQDLAKANFKDLVVLHPKEIQRHVDDNGFVSPEGAEMAVAYNDVIPMLHSVVNDLSEKNKEQQAQIGLLVKQIDALMKRIELIESQA